MKKLLIIGASILQVPAILKAKELGFYTAVIDYDENAVGIKYADEFFCVSTIDIEGVTNTAKKFQPDGIVTLATDMPMRSIAKACSELSLCGIDMDTAIKSTDKGEMIKAFKEHNVPSPWFFIVENEGKLEKIKSEIKYPCIMKPLDNSGSRGVMLINGEDELSDSFTYSISQSRGAGVIVEEYLKGDEVSVEIIVSDGVVTILAITDKLTTGAPHFVEMGHSQQSKFSEGIKNDIKDVATKAVKAVGIKNGPAHVEIMVTENGAKMIELGARMGGDCITTHLVPLSTGIDMIEATIRCSLGEKPDLEPKFSKGSAIRYFEVDKGTISKIEGVDVAEKIDGVKEISFVKNVGDAVGDIDSSVSRVGFVIAQGKSAEDAVEICKKAIEKIKIEVL